MQFADLKGRWKLTESSAKALPESCRSLVIEVFDQGIRTFSGKQVITADCQIAQKHDDFVFLVKSVHVNDEPGCDGMTPDQVKTRYKMLQIWRPAGDRITVLAPKPIFELQKLELCESTHVGGR